MMFRNRIHNGGFNIWQRTTASTVTAAGAYTTADRWCGALLATGLTLAQSATVPAGAGFPYSLSVTTTTTGSGSVPLIEHRIESFNVTDLAINSTVTLSFWASQTGGTLMPLVVGLFTPTTTVDVFSAQTAAAAGLSTPTLTGTMTNYTLTFTLTSAVTKGLCVRFTTSVTVLGTTGVFLLTGIQLEKGITASPFEFRPYSVELALCQRYYYKIVSPTAAVLGTTPVNSVFGSATAASTTAFQVPIPFPVTMRVANYAISNSAASNFQVFAGTLIAVTGLTPLTDSYSPSMAILSGTVASGLTAAGSYLFKTNALTSTTTAYIDFSCDL